ncbi:MAG: hypothetical protein ACP5SP_06570 [Caldisericum sp.]|uniref:hypothetical protein n=1 Tax=Caldisericum sp. TaxID=2499687 RepID=UPI003D0D935A
MSDFTLREYAGVIFKWKLLILGIVIVTVLFSSVLNFFVFKNVFEGVGTLFPAQIGSASGQLQNGSPLLSIGETMQIATSDDFMQKLANNLSIPLSEFKNNYDVKSTQTQNSNQRLFEISFQSADINSIKNFFGEFVSLLNDYVKGSYEQQINSLKDYINQLTSQVDTIDAHMTDVSKKMLELVNKDGSVKSEFYLEYATLRSTYDSLGLQEMQLKQQIADINLGLNNSNLYYFQNGYSILEKPVKPRRLFNIAVSAVTAFFFSILLAFFLEYWHELTIDKKNL